MHILAKNLGSIKRIVPFCSLIVSDSVLGAQRNQATYLTLYSQQWCMTRLCSPNTLMRDYTLMHNSYSLIITWNIVNIYKRKYERKKQGRKNEITERNKFIPSFE